MKHLLLMFAALVLSIGTMNAQNEELTSGNFMLETNTSFGTFFGSGGAGLGNTGISFFSTDGATTYSLGAEAGYFVIDRLAIKLGMGYSGGNDDSGALGIFNYKLGAKYYIIDKIPAELSLTGSSIEDFDENPMFLGMQAGYALFLANNKVSVEPGFRYNLSLNDDFFDSFFQFNVGFAVHL